jgi:hypothetical protein
MSAESMSKVLQPGSTNDYPRVKTAINVSMQLSMVILFTTAGALAVASYDPGADVNVNGGYQLTMTVVYGVISTLVLSLSVYKINKIMKQYNALQKS